METIDRYERLLKKIWENSLKYLGLFPVKLLVERVVWDVAKDYPEAELISWGEDGISLAPLREAMERGEEVALEEMMDAFVARYVEILAKLLGKDKAERIRYLLEEEMK